MSNYVVCVNNQTLFTEDIADNYFPELIIGRVYKVVPPEENDGDMLRVIDGSGEDYLYPAAYFKPFLPTNGEVSESVTIHLGPYLKGVLHAEAVAAQKSISSLVRKWIDERLDLPA